MGAEPTLTALQGEFGASDRDAPASAVPLKAEPILAGGAARRCAGRSENSGPATEGKHRDRRLGWLALAASLGVHAGALASLLLLQVELTPVPLGVVGLVSLEAGEASGGAEAAPLDSVGAAMPEAEAVPLDAVSAAMSKAEAVPAPPAKSVAQATALPLAESAALIEAYAQEHAPEPAEALLLAALTPAAEAPEKPETILEALALLSEATTRRLPQTDLLGTVKAKLVQEPAAKPMALSPVPDAAPPLPLRKPALTADARTAVSTKPTGKTTDEAKTQSAALPGSKPATTGVERSSPSAGSGQGDGQGAGAGSAPRFAGGGLSNPPPRYPKIARRKGQEGRVVLRVRVTADGTASAVTIRQSSGYPLLDNAAASAIEKWRFIPAKLGGIAMAGLVDVPVTFRLTGR